MVTALVMAGGKGTRMGTRIEKPLIELGGIPMIKRVIDAISASNKVHEIIIATSPNTPKTHEFVQKRGYKVFQTPGKGYVEDLQYFISENYPEDPNHIILTITADMPLITSETIDDILSEYEMCGNPAMCVAVPVQIFRKYGLRPSIVLEDVVPSGLNILRSNNKQQDEEVLKLGKIELAVNINSCEDIVVLEEVMSYIGIKIR
jgi:adenosylcobinamide-phosphate guanylyltransferase